MTEILERKPIALIVPIEGEAETLSGAMRTYIGISAVPVGLPWFTNDMS